MRIGLTGGIGSGKSTVAGLLAGHGAAIVDADLIAREVVEPGGPAYTALVERFGEKVLAADGIIDRAALAAVAFGDPAALEDLNAITHPQIGREMARRLDELDAAEPTGATGATGATAPKGETRIVVAVIPLLGAHHIDALGLGAVVVVDCPVNVAVARLVQRRGMSELDARARIAAQSSREERLALADYVVDNSSDPEHLTSAVDELWSCLRARSMQPRQNGHSIDRS